MNIKCTTNRSRFLFPFLIFQFQEIFHEHSTHLRILHEHQQSKSLLKSTVIESMRNAMVKSHQTCSRHSPYMIFGESGSGKSTLIAELYQCANKWFEHVKIYRVIRFAAATPRSAYNLELLRVICQHISIILNIPEGYLPKDASFDPVYINQWYQNLLRRCEEAHNNAVILLFIDDLHKLNPLDCDNVSALSWLPISLPRNVHLICTTGVPIDALRLTQMQKERFKQNDCLFDLNVDVNETIVKKVLSHETFNDYIQRQFDELEKSFGVKGFGRLATYLSCTEYGLTETELLELLMPISNSEALLDTTEGDFNFSTFRCIRNQMSKFSAVSIAFYFRMLKWLKLFFFFCYSLFYFVFKK